MTEINQKELTVVKQQISKALIAATDMQIKTDDDFRSATDVLSKIKQVGNIIKARKEEITRPLMTSLKSVRDLFKPLEANHSESERIIKGKMLSYQSIQEEKRAEEKRKLAERVARGTMKPETAIDKMDSIQEVRTNVKGKVGEVSTRTLRKVRVLDETKVPREYLSLNMPKINEAMLKKGVEIDGLEVYEEKVIAAR